MIFPSLYHLEKLLGDNYWVVQSFLSKHTLCILGNNNIPHSCAYIKHPVGTPFATESVCVLTANVRLLVSFFESHITARSFTSQCALHGVNSHRRRLSRLLQQHMWLEAHHHGSIAWVSPTQYICQYLASCAHLLPLPKQELPILISFDGMTCGALHPLHANKR